MRKIKFRIILGRWSEETEIEVDEDITDEEINEMFVEWQLEQLDGGWEEIS